MTEIVAKATKGSWQTTLAGVLAVLVVLIGCAHAHFDGNPATVPQWELALGTVLAALGLTRARDDKVTSKAAGAEK